MNEGQRHRPGGRRGWRGGRRPSRGYSHRSWRPCRSRAVFHGRVSCPSPSLEADTSDAIDLAGMSRAPVYQPSLYSPSTFASDPFCPFRGWKLYFPHEEYSADSPTNKKVKTLEQFFQVHRLEYQKEEIEEKRSFLVNLEELLRDQSIKEGFLSLREELMESPDTIMAMLGLAMHQLMVTQLEQELSTVDSSVENADGSSSRPKISLPHIQPRPINWDSPTPIKDLKASLFGKFVAIRGTIVRVSPIRPLCTRMAFRCFSCCSEFIMTLPEGKFSHPTKCPSSECRAKSFEPLPSSPLTETVDYQTVRVQDVVSDEEREGGRVPRTIDCELTCDLVNSCVPGDNVTVTGVVRIGSSDQEAMGSRDKCTFSLYLQAYSLTKGKGEGDGTTGIEFTVRDYYAIQEIQAEPNLFGLLMASLCPAICGHEMVKAGLTLALFGGVPKVEEDGSTAIRGDIHVLVVGDPGLGKSQLLQACISVAPRGVYVCGNTTTTAGLTVTMTKEGGTGEHALEAGALVLADSGTCCIDEFDKMGGQHQALLEAMEQQSISLAKAGMICSLPARTSILAAANPVGGHYNRAKTVAENLHLNPALLSRFDLVFILLDRPDEDTDSTLSKHVMALHNEKKAGSAGSRVHPSCVFDSGTPPSDKPLAERLKQQAIELADPIPHQLIRKYLAYARKYVKPRLSPGAKRVLQKFYLDLRERAHTFDCTPITTRQLESLIRLTQARARVDLHEEASEQDAQDVVDVLKWSMVDTFSDEFGLLDLHRAQHGSGMSSRGQAKKFILLLHRVSETQGKNMFSYQELLSISRQGRISTSDFSGFISSLNLQGFLLKKGPNLYQLQTAE